VVVTPEESSPQKTLPDEFIDAPSAVPLAGRETKPIWQVKKEGGSTI
jgi:hypothetical protein